MPTLKMDIQIPRNDDAWHEPPLRSEAGVRSWTARSSVHTSAFRKGTEMTEQPPGPIDLDGVVEVADVGLDADHTAAIYAQDGTYLLRIFDDNGIDEYITC